MFLRECLLDGRDHEVALVVAVAQDGVELAPEVEHGRYGGDPAAGGGRICGVQRLLLIDLSLKHATFKIENVYS